MARLTPLLAVLLLAGCDSKPVTGTTTVAVGREAAQAPPPAADAAPGRAAAPQAGGVAAGKPEELAVERKIVYSAAVELVVTSIEAVGPQVEKLVTDFKGSYVAKSDLHGQAGRSRTATWTLKVPAADFRVAVARLVALGQAVRNSSTSDDVTAEYVDLESRIKNLKVAEDKLNQMLAEPGVRYDDRIKISEQIEGVRGRIEQAQGRLKYLGAMAALSTITLQVREEVPYVPEPLAVAPTFTEQIAARFQGSTDSVTRLGKWWVLWAVEVAPYLPLYLPLAAVGFWAARRLLRWQRGYATATA